MKTLTKILLSIFLLANLSLVKAETLHDFDGDRTSDIVAYRRNDPNIDWYVFAML
jgi:hypothetical protein